MTTELEEFNEMRREERRVDRACADLFVRACKGRDRSLLIDAADQISRTGVGGWAIAIRRIAREIKTPVHREIQLAFLGEIWPGHKSLSLTVGDDKALLAALRVLVISYCGPARRLFRGTAARERRVRRYGMSWSSSREIGEIFADPKRHGGEDSVLIETIAPPEAILCDVAVAGGPNDESEYLVDRWFLTAVKLVRRYEGIPMPETRCAP